MSKDYTEENLAKLYELEIERDKLEQLADEKLSRGERAFPPLSWCSKTRWCCLELIFRIWLGWLMPRKSRRRSLGGHERAQKNNLIR